MYRQAFSLGSNKSCYYILGLALFEFLNFCTIQLFQPFFTVTQVQSHCIFYILIDLGQ